MACNNSHIAYIPSWLSRIPVEGYWLMITFHKNQCMMLLIHASFYKAYAGRYEVLIKRYICNIGAWFLRGIWCAIQFLKSCYWQNAIFKSKIESFGKLCLSGITSSLNMLCFCRNIKCTTIFIYYHFATLYFNGLTALYVFQWFHDHVYFTMVTFSTYRWAFRG